MVAGLLSFLPGVGGEAPPPESGEGASRDVAVRYDASILIIEDEVMIAWMLSSMIEEMGFTNIEIACSADEARAMASRAAPDLIVSDINLGKGADGIEAAAEIGHAGVIPVLFVTAYADDSVRARIADAVPTAQLLRKPIESDVLRRAIVARLGGGAPQ